MRDLTDGVAEVDVDGATLRQVIRELDERYAGFAARVVKDDRLVPGLAVSVDNVVSSRGLLTPVGPGSVVHFVPAIAGG